MQVGTARYVNLVLGVWLFISAFIWEHTAAERTNTWILGVLFVVFALVAMRSTGARWVNTALSIWLFISVWALPHDNAGTMWNNALVAIVVFIASLVAGPAERPGIPQRAPV
jgi:hypothetical protein